MVGAAALVWVAAIMPAVASDAASVTWPDTPLARAEAMAVIETLNADLLSHDSATLTLERWCGAHELAMPAKVIAQRVHGQDKPLSPELRAQMGIDAQEPVKYRRVQLMCGAHVLSEADNWYVPARLTAAMNSQLDNSDTPFGKVVQPLHFRRQTLDANVLWSPLPNGWEKRGVVSAPSGTTLQIPSHILQHRAVLYTSDNRPFSLVVETYTDQLLAFSPPPVR